MSGTTIWSNETLFFHNFFRFFSQTNAITNLLFDTLDDDLPGGVGDVAVARHAAWYEHDADAADDDDDVKRVFFRLLVLAVRRVGGV